ncbi:MAG: ABC transporter ATP-binding protein [Actinobacteria bacterium]|nr:ABC transporter ATP-binding protein [Actinomycetota bacterium]
MIRLDGATKTFPGTSTPAVDALSLEVPTGEIVVFVGPSGCGKTTTLKMINRIIEPTGGTITVDGVDVRDREPHLLRRDIGYVIQQIGLFPHRTIAQNVATVPRLLGWDEDRTRARVDELLVTMGLDEELGARYPAELSGGQRQRVGVARALAADPPVLLMDEPFGAVDPIVRGRLQVELLDLQARLRKTIVFVTHDIDEAIHLGDRIAILNVGGHLEQYAPPEDILREPATPFVEEFLGPERGLKRLALRTVADLGELGLGNCVQADASVEEAAQVAAEHQERWIGILDGDRLRGWAWVSDLDGARRAGDVETSLFRVALSAEDTLRAALDGLVRSRTGVAVVLGPDQRYDGMITLARLNQAMVS